MKKESSLRGLDANTKESRMTNGFREFMQLPEQKVSELRNLRLIDAARQPFKSSCVPVCDERVKQTRDEFFITSALRRHFLKKAPSQVSADLWS